MSETKNPLDAMLAQYEKNTKPKYTKSETAKVYDLKNYFTAWIADGIKTATKEIRILPTPDGSSPFVEIYAHKVKVDGETKTFACLKHERNQPCPFCEARELLLATGKESDKELAKKYNARLMYVVKVIDRSVEDEGVKFWRIPHDYTKKGAYDMINGITATLKKNRDITNAENGRDLSLVISRNQNNFPIVSTITSQDASPLSEDAEKATAWLGDTRTWEDVYAVKPYEYLEIIVKGGVPVWDKEEKKFVDKASKAEASTDSEAEITMGVENVKAGVVAASTMETPEAMTTIEATEEDDLPF